MKEKKVILPFHTRSSNSTAQVSNGSPRTSHCAWWDSWRNLWNALISLSPQCVAADWLCKKALSISNWGVLFYFNFISTFFYKIIFITAEVGKGKKENITLSMGFETFTSIIKGRKLTEWYNPQLNRRNFRGVFELKIEWCNLYYFT